MRPKWLKSIKNRNFGYLVLVAEDRYGPGQWLLGRIVDTYPGSDGKIKNNIFKRPISKIFLLPENSSVSFKEVSEDQPEATINVQGRA